RSVGVSQAALEAALEYAREREQFGQPIAKFQAIKFKLARMATEVETARTMMWRAAWLFDQGYCMREAAMAKLFASEVAQRVTWEAVQIFGGYGYITEFPVERFWLAARTVHLALGEHALGYFAPVADRPGFPLAVARTLAELRLNHVVPESLAVLGALGRDLGMLAGRVARELEEAGLADRAIVFEA